MMLLLHEVFIRRIGTIRKSFNPSTLLPESYALHRGVKDKEGLPVTDIKSILDHI